MLIDICLVLFVLLLAYTGRRKGFVKSALGMVSALACGIITALVYKFSRGTQLTSYVEDFLLTFFKSEQMKTVVDTYLAEYVVGAFVLVIVFILVRFVYGLLTDVVNFVVPGFINNPLGAALGFVKGIMIVFCLLAVVYYADGTSGGFVDKIDDTVIASVLYYNNPIVHIVKF